MSDKTLICFLTLHGCLHDNAVLGEQVLLCLVVFQPCGDGITTGRPSMALAMTNSTFRNAFKLFRQIFGEVFRNLVAVAGRNDESDGAALVIRNFGGFEKLLQPWVRRTITTLRDWQTAPKRWTA